jgi:hypothetical protein
MNSRGLEITIATENDVMLESVSTGTGTGVIPLSTTVNQLYNEQEDGKVLKERTLLFETTDKPEYLDIKGMHYMKPYNQVIEISVEE